MSFLKTDKSTSPVVAFKDLQPGDRFRFSYRDGLSSDYFVKVDDDTFYSPVIGRVRKMSAPDAPRTGAVVQE